MKLWIELKKPLPSRLMVTRTSIMKPLVTLMRGGVANSIDLCMLGTFLNPEFFYANPSIEQDEEVMTGLDKSIARVVPNLIKQDNITEELTVYKRAEGLFGMDMAIRQRKTKAPDKVIFFFLIKK